MKQGFLPGHRVHGQQYAAVFAAGDILQHFALAAARSALMHNDQIVVILGRHQGAGSVGRYPALLLTDVQKNRINALLCGRPRIQVVGKYLMAVVQAVMHDHLLAVKVSVSERGRYINDCARRITLGVLRGNKTLQMRHSKCKKRCVARANKHRAIAINIAARIKGHKNQLLALEPFERFLLHVRKREAVHVGKTRLIGRFIVANTHAVRVAAAHVILHVVDDHAVLGADNRGFCNHALAGHIINDVVLSRTAGAKDHVIKLLLGGRDKDPLAVFNYIDDLG